MNSNITPIILFCLALAGVALRAAEARLRGQDGTLSLLIAVPLTKGNQTVIDPGFFHLAAARLAVDHFNSRNGSVVKQLDTLGECSITFGNVTAVDTGMISHQAMESVVESLGHGSPPDAIAGPYNEIPALELSVLATGMKSPIVAHRMFDHNLLSPERHPFFSQVNADAYSEMSFVGNYLQHINRTNFIAVVHSASASVIQKADILRNVLEKEGFDQVRTFSYNSEILEHSGGPEVSPRSILKKVQQAGFRTIVLLPGAITKERIEIGAAAAEFGLDSGRHAWILSGGADLLDDNEVGTFLRQAWYDRKSDFLNGAAYMFPYDGFELDRRLNFPRFLANQDADFLRRVQELIPSPQLYDDELKKVANDTLPLVTLAMELASWMPGTGFMYDAVMSLGLGACAATSDTLETTMTGLSHLEGIRSLEFLGASGTIKFGNLAGNPGSRVGSTVPFTVVNFFLNNQTEEYGYQQTETLDPVTAEWIQVAPFLYADGTTNPPDLLREQPDQNHITQGARATGMALFAIALATIIFSFLWVVVYREHTVVVAAQPIFLYIVCFGSTLNTFSILLGAFDESWGFTNNALDASCFLFVWTDALGTMIVYSAIFTKLWRVNRCLRYNTNRVAMWRVIWPSALLILAAIAILTAWTIHGEFGWIRVIIDDVSGESVGLCDGESVYQYSLPVYALHFIPIILSGVMAYKTLGLDNLYSESKWVLALLLVQFQVHIVGAPVILLVNEVDPSLRYITISLLTFTFPCSTMGLIVLPKALLVRRMKRQSDSPTQDTASSLSAAPPTPDATSPAVRDGANGHATNTDMMESLSPTQVRRSSSSGPRIQVVTFD